MCAGQISRRVKSPLSKCGIITCLLLAGGLWLASQTCASELMLPQVYTGQVDVAGWLMSEKLDGVRGYWDGRQLLSQSGNPLHPPAAFIRDLPPFPLEGELWGGRGRFEQTIGSVKRQQSDPGWLQLKFAIFDVPQAPGGFRERMRQASDWFADHPTNYAFIIPQIPVRDQAHLQQELERIERLGGEGLIVRRPDARYRAGRSMEILKVKSHQDAEATVLAQLPGEGRNAGRLGALQVELEDGTRFRIGSGLSDADRDSPPPVGSLITFKYYGTYQSGIPKFPVFLRLRSDRDL
jgi:DNA ligase-1